MKKYFSICLICIISFYSCSKKEDPFLIAKGQLGALNITTTVSQLDSIYATDSLVKIARNDPRNFRKKDQYLIYEKGGKHLLTISPSLDSTATIENIQVFDNRYRTVKGITIESTFKEISDQYKISKIETIGNNVVLLIDEIDAHFTISREELPADIRFDRSKKIEAVHIPNTAKIKYFMIGWN